ncbi:MAG: hypothetical protein M1404_05800 [Acidobacteria bacterium]|nr:hypothetical protein [Acidobacteriota bacterium]
MKFLTCLCTMMGTILFASASLAAQQHATFIDLLSQPRWQMESSQTINLNDVRRWGGEPAVDREYGVKSVEIRTYREGEKTAQAIVEEAQDPSSAYGLFTFYLSETMAPVKGMKLAVVSPQQGYMARGRAFVRVLRPANMSNKDFDALLLSIGGASPSEQSMALLPPPLPVNGLVPGSEKYLLGPIAASRALPLFRTDVVGFSQGAELQAATYQIDGQRVNFFLISYPTSQIANLRYRAITHLLGLNQGSGPGSLFGKLKGTYLLMVQNAPSLEVANRLMNRLSVSQVLSWNEPPPEKPITVQMFHLIVGNILLVLILIAMAGVAGVLIFMSRRLAAKWFPQSDWARGYEDSIIRLNLK